MVLPAAELSLGRSICSHAGGGRWGHGGGGRRTAVSSVTPRWPPLKGPNCSCHFSGLSSTGILSELGRWHWGEHLWVPALAPRRTLVSIGNRRGKLCSRCSPFLWQSVITPPPTLLLLRTPWRGRGGCCEAPQDAGQGDEQRGDSSAIKSFSTSRFPLKFWEGSVYPLPFLSQSAHSSASPPPPAQSIHAFTECL